MNGDNLAQRAQRRLSRRRFLRGAGVAAVAGAVATSGIAKLVSQAEAAEKGEKTNDLAKRQWMMIIDLRRCDGCRLCIKACQAGHYLPDEQRWIEVYEMENSTGGTYFLPRPCMQCENAPCLRVCPVGATFKSPDGAILVDQNTCIGCRMCMAACPYDARYFNWDDPPSAPKGLGGFTPEFPVPQQRGTVGKCVICVHNTRMGKLPMCVDGCPMKAIYIGDLAADIATNGVDTVKVSQFLRDNDAVRYKEDLGTRPRVYYILGHGQVWGRK